MIETGTYTVTMQGEHIADVHVTEEGTLVRWDGEQAWTLDDEALAMVLFPDDLDVKIEKA